MYNHIDWIKRHKVISLLIVISVLIIIVFVIPIIISFLFISNGGISLKWGAKDYLLFYGSFLAFIGTTFLGIVAINQNKKADLNAKKSNEINIINKIISIEEEKISQIETVLDEFSELCNPQFILRVLLRTDDNENIELRRKTDLVKIENNLDSQLFIVARKTKPYLNEEQNKDYILSFGIAHIGTKAYIKFLRDNLDDDNFTESNDHNKNIIKYKLNYLNLVKEKELFYQQLHKRLDIVMFGDKTLNEIKEMYSFKLFDKK